MLKALVLKELRETAGIALAALAVHAYFLSGYMGLQLMPWGDGSQGPIPFVGDSFAFTLGLVAAGMALWLGFRQTIGESRRGTWLFLLHRPVERWCLVGVKLLVGGGWCLVASALPILAYAGWAATPGTHASPFEWSMTYWAWATWIAMPVLYLGSFLSGIRPARWLGSRLAPLAAAGALSYGVLILLWLSVFWLLAVLIADALLVACVFYVAETRDY